MSNICTAHTCTSHTCTAHIFNASFQGPKHVAVPPTWTRACARSHMRVPATRPAQSPIHIPNVSVSLSCNFGPHVYCDLLIASTLACTAHMCTASCVLPPGLPVLPTCACSYVSSPIVASNSHRIGSLCTVHMCTASCVLLHTFMSCPHVHAATCPRHSSRPTATASDPSAT